jgi:hypothetical protein
MMPKRKGQVALEAAFVVLFISIAIGGIIMKTTTYIQHAEVMSRSRAIAQQVAFELTMEGVRTHLIRIDPIDLTDAAVQVHVLSEGCANSGGITAIENRFSDAIGNVSVNCRHELYTDTKFT